VPDPAAAQVGIALAKPQYEGGHEVRVLVRLAGGLLVMICGPEACATATTSVESP
jgi:hypothetical protein